MRRRKHHSNRERRLKWAKPQSSARDPATRWTAISVCPSAAAASRWESQEWLGDQLGLTFQQVQKGQNGANRVGGSRMVGDRRRAADLPSFFFEGNPSSEAAGAPRGVNGKHSSDDPRDSFLASRTGIELARAFVKIKKSTRQGCSCASPRNLLASDGGGDKGRSERAARVTLFPLCAGSLGPRPAHCRRGRPVIPLPVPDQTDAR